VLDEVHSKYLNAKYPILLKTYLKYYLNYNKAFIFVFAVDDYKSGM